MKRKIILMIACLLIIQSQAHAQFDDLGDSFPPPPPPPAFDDYTPPPPPAADSNDNFSGSHSTNSGSSGTGATTSRASSADQKDGLLSRKQKDKFAKAQIEDITNENFPEIIDSFDYPNADITDLAKAISELTGKNFIVDPGVRGKITIISPSKITVAEAYKAFLSALAINGYAVVPSGSFYKIRSSRNAQRDGIETYSGNYYPNSDQMITRIINLKHINAEAVNRELRVLTSKDGEISTYTPTNSIIVSDYGSNIDRIMKIISQLDIAGFEDQLEVIPIKFAKAKDIAELVNKIVNKGETQNRNTGGTFSAGVPRFNRPTTNNNGGQNSAYFMVIPDDRSNALVVVGNKAGISKVRKLIGQLDFRIRPEDAGGVYVYYIKHGDAKKIATTLSGIAKDGAPKANSGGSPLLSPLGGIQQQQQEIFGGDVKITADEGTNAIVIVASKQDYEIVLNLLNKIDIPRDQVFVETIVMEMSNGDANNWNVGYFKYGEGGYGKSGFNSFDSTTLANLLSPQGGSGAILGFGSQDTVELKNTDGTSSKQISSLLGFINFLKTNTNANILSTPQVLAMDNQEAELEVGDKIVIGTQETAATSTSAGVRTPQFGDASIKLKIKPFISPASNSIRMELETSVAQLSNAPTPKGLQDTTQPLATRKLKTNIVVPNKDTAVMGGLMKDDDQEAISKVPVLGDIPILGWLFKSRNTVRKKTNMLLFVTPTIVRNGEDNRKVLNKKLSQRLNHIKSQGGRDPYGETIETIERHANRKGDRSDDSSNSQETR